MLTAMMIKINEDQIKMKCKVCEKLHVFWVRNRIVSFGQTVRGTPFGSLFLTFTPKLSPYLVV